MESKDDMFNGQGFMKPLRTPRLDVPSKRKSQRPLPLWLGASALLGAGAFNLVTFVTGVVILLSDYEESTTVVLLVALSLSAIFLVVLPFWTGIAALQRSATASGWAILYFVAQFLVAFQSIDPAQFFISAVALAAAILLWIPATRAYSRGS
ncbi:hypothetical protein [Cryobacterium fucosi]|uniref:Uncharacterized protein n=1 Tax=Cryobacterium fucosi TaxID=1259157 RepID=A0A4R9B5M4_9MICO|nr:hypothetical protein [Cryobacterium fucosi]TFD76043.1 hypothetical protein E3T48_10735 [Cryobacterium fucosi]